MELAWTTKPFPQLTSDELYDALQLRMQVFVVEQDAVYQDLDDKDRLGLHMFGRHDEKLCAYQRCLPPGVSYPESSLGRIIVTPTLRGLNVGRELVRRGIECNRAHWPDSEICISAQAHLQDFYASFGFVSEGDEYAEDGIPHRKMRLGLPS